MLERFSNIRPPFIGGFFVIISLKDNNMETNNIIRNKTGRPSLARRSLVDVHVGNRIRFRRQALQLSQSELARQMGVTFQQIQKYERGINRITAGRLWDLSCVLDVDINFFFEDLPEEMVKYSPRMMSVHTHHQKIQKITPERTSEAQELIRYYFKIKNRTTAKIILSLVENITTHTARL